MIKTIVKAVNLKLTFKTLAAKLVNFAKDESTLVKVIDNPYPQVKAAKEAIIPIFGFLFPYLNIKAAKGINAIKGILSNIDEIIHIK